MSAPATLGDYTLYGELGRGAHGVVWDARRADGARVALKRFDVALVPENELRAQVATLRACPHRGLVDVHGVESIDGVAFLAMELVDGADFVAHVRADAIANDTSAPHLPLAFGQALRPLGSSAFAPNTSAGLSRLCAALAQLADALEALHALGFVHRDLHPANVRVTAQGRVVVLDVATLPSIGALHDPTRAVGPVSHAAPELGDELPLTPACDWYAVGVLLFEALTGDLPFSGSGRDVFVRKQTVSAPSPGLLLRGVPDPLDTLCVALLATAPSQRADGAVIRRTLAAMVGR